MAAPASEVPPPDDRMADGDQQQRATKKFRTAKRSFADTVASQATFTTKETPREDAHDWAFEDPIIASDDEIDMQDKADGRPRVVFPKELRKELCQDWKLALIIKFLGKNVSFSVLNQRLLAMWGLQGRFHLIDIGFGFFVARFDNKTDYLHVLLDGPWKIFDNYLVAQRWEPDFKPRMAKLKKMAVWVRLPELSMEYFRDDTVKLILENVGKRLKLDRATAIREKGRFARAAIEVDLDKPLVTEIWVQNEVQMVEYEGLHVVCFGCGVVGHREQDCPLNQPKPQEPPPMDLNSPPSAERDETQQPPTPSPTPTSSPPAVAERPRYGSWMLVTRKPRNYNQNNNHQQAKQSQPNAKSNHNRFQALANNKERSTPNKSSSNKGKQPAQAGGNGKGKSSSPMNPPPNRRGAVPVESLVVPPNNSRNSANSSRNRGGHAGTNRGKSGNHRGGGASTSGSFPAGGNWPSNLETSGVFQFGRSTQLHNVCDTNVQGQHGPRSSTCPTPGEGGHPTSLPANSST
ncbi:uncharacterized protein LOC116015889 [Ipomoea triloba]|uniref:uncharacterized protein LOC116015889 n=1 Tax=Ipomoea triloba TaxID=35885 RepID=UPI00125D27A8|nr:uncharacterized protein LOC116015889 [Ipomoea triloba]